MELLRVIAQEHFLTFHSVVSAVLSGLRTFSLFPEETRFLNILSWKRIRNAQKAPLSTWKPSHVKNCETSLSRFLSYCRPMPQRKNVASSCWINWICIGAVVVTELVGSIKRRSVKAAASPLIYAALIHED